MRPMTEANYIAGKWIDALQPSPVLSPRDGEQLGVIDRASSVLVAEAVGAAAAALDNWAERRVEDRCRFLGKFADLLVREYGNEGQPSPLKELIRREMGKTLPEADVEVIESSDMVRYFADHAPALLSEQTVRIQSEMWASKKSIVRFEPHGVVGIIKPWNYPLEIPLWSIGPALAAGNTIVFKPSELSSLVGLQIGKLFEEAGLPAGVLNIVTGGAETGRAIVENADVSMISFTGSVATGREISERAGGRLAVVNVELGGVDAAVVLNDANLELASNGVLWGAVCNSGQVCVGTKRVFVASEIFDEVEASVTGKAEQLRKDVDYGPIVSLAQLEKIEQQVQRAIDQGAKVACGGHRIGGLYYAPTVLVDVAPSMDIVREECFGPVIPLIRYKGDDHEVELLVNDSKYGLGASIWTGDLGRGTRLANRLQVGMVWINDVNVAFAEAPWSARRNSGHGVELSSWGLHEYTTIKHISIEESDAVRRDWWYPYN